MKSNNNTSKNVIKKLICFGIVTTSLFVGGTGFVNANEVYAATATASKGIKNNGYNGIKIDINVAPYTTFSKISGVGQYAYGKSGCAWFASSRVKQVTGKGSTIWGGPSWYNTQYKNYGFTRGSTPKAKSLACFQGHVAYVESVSGSDMVISEGGSWYYSDAQHGYCVIRKVNIKKYQTGMGSNFLGYVYLDGSSNTNSKTISTNSTASNSSEKVKGSVEENKSVSKWVKDSKTGKMMYYGADGKKYTGWHYMGSAEGEKTSHWSYFGDDGLLRTGWQRMGTKTNPDDGDPEHWSYFGPNGWLRTGWQKMGTKTNPDGDSKEHWSYFGSNGWLRTGWQKMGTKTNPDGKSKEHWSYYGPNGWLRTGWQKMGTKDNPDGKNPVHQSYFGINGWLVTGKKVINGKTYMYNSNGWKI